MYHGWLSKQWFHQTKWVWSIQIASIFNLGISTLVTFNVSMLSINDGHLSIDTTCVFTLIWERAASTVYIIISLGRFLYLGFLSTFLRYQIFTRGVYICKHKGFSFIFHRNFFSLFFHVPPSTRPFIHFIPKIKTNQRSMLRLIHCIAIDRWPGEYKIYRHDWNFDGVY